MNPLTLLRTEAPGRIEELLDLRQSGRPESAWAWICRNVIRPDQEPDQHLALYRWVYGLKESDGFPRPAWIPDDATVRDANITALCRQPGLDGPRAFQTWSVENRADFWALMLRSLDIRFERDPATIRDDGREGGPARWLPGSRFNPAASCFLAPPEKTAITLGREDGTLEHVSYRELRVLADRVANGLRETGIAPGDPVAVILPMTVESVAIYLGILLAGAVAVSIADSFAASEIATRLRISRTRLVFTRDVLVRNGKEIPLYPRVCDAGTWPAVVIPIGDTSQTALRDGDRNWCEFLSGNDSFTPVARKPDDTLGILFSSGTTADPKAIPWTSTTPLKCAADAFIHHDIHPGDRVCWPTNLGWMMGPWLIFASLINRATMALFAGIPQQPEFLTFVRQAEVTMLGVIPSLVRTWRENRDLEQVDWRCVRTFSSTGECSDPSDMFYLMSRAGFRPVIEYCGGTEIGGGYIAGTVARPAIPGTFNLPACGLDLVILDEAGRPGAKGEVFLSGPSIGLSSRLLNADHDAVYHAGVPDHPKSGRLRRHGDHLEALPGGYFRALGRHDDSMNLGGIKIGSAEIERAVCLAPGVHEAAAIALDNAGPARLVVFAVASPGCEADVDELHTRMDAAIREHLNPLFKIHQVHLVDRLPRTASNKVMRRTLRGRLQPG